MYRKPNLGGIEVFYMRYGRVESDNKKSTQTISLISLILFIAYLSNKSVFIDETLRIPNW